MKKAIFVILATCSLAANAAWSDIKYQDKMTGQVSVSKVLKSIDGAAKLEFDPDTNAVWIVLPKSESIAFKGWMTSARIKIGDKLQTTMLGRGGSNSQVILHEASVGIPDSGEFDQKKIAKSILSTKEKILIEVPTKYNGNKVFEFNPN